LKIGVLAIQGSIKEHMNALNKCGVETVEVRLPEHLENVSGLIIPGGESTTIGKMMEKYGLDREIRKRHQLGMPIYGTCAGAILLSRKIIGNSQPSLGLASVSIKRNEYGRQIDSFESLIVVDGFETPFNAIFIRAPVIQDTFNGAKVLATFNNKPVLLREGSLLLSTFHPELTDDLRIHNYFIDMIKKGPEF